MFLIKKGNQIVDKHSRKSHKYVFYEIVDFFVLDMPSKPTFFSKVAHKGKEPQKVAQKLPSTIGTGLLRSAARIYFYL